MAISDTARHSDLYSPNGSTTRFAFGFVVFDATQVAVYESDGDTDSLVSSSRFTVVLNDDQDNHPGGFVEFADAPAAGKKLRILSAVPYHQPMVLTNRGGFYPDVINRNADLQCAQIQQLREELDRSVKIPATSSGTAAELVETLLNARNDAERLLPYADEIQTVAENMDAVENAAQIAGELDERIDSLSINAMDYGAVGDGVTDDTAALNAAVTAAAGKLLYLPAGTYLTSTGIGIPSNTTVCGAGRNATIIKLSASASSEITCVRNAKNTWVSSKAQAELNTGDSNIVLRDLTVDGNWSEITDRETAAGTGTHTYYGCAIRFAFVDGLLVENVHATNGKLHSLDIASRYYTEEVGDNDYEAYGCNHVTLNNVVASNSRLDDCLTTHHSRNITINNPLVYRTQPLRKDQCHGLEIDDGSSFVTINGGYVTGSNCGLQIKAHASNTKAPHDIHVTGLVCEGNLLNFWVTHSNCYLNGTGDPLRNITLENCTSIKPVKPQKEEGATYYADHCQDLYLSGVSGGSVKNFKIVGGGEATTNACVWLLGGTENVSFDGLSIENRVESGSLVYCPQQCHSGITFRNTTVSDCSDVPVWYIGDIDGGLSVSIDGVRATRSGTGTSPVVVTAYSNLFAGHDCLSIKNVISYSGYKSIVGETVSGSPGNFAIGQVQACEASFRTAPDVSWVRAATSGGDAGEPVVAASVGYACGSQNLGIGDGAALGFKFKYQNSTQANVAYVGAARYSGTDNKTAHHLVFATVADGDTDGPTIRWTMRHDGNLWPKADGSYAIGGASNRISQLYASTSTISTSDARLKRDIADIPDEVLDAWGEVGWCEFRFKAGTRLHTGLIAQIIDNTFKAHGLTATDYGLLCRDEWQADEEHAEPGYVWSVRYEEALAMEAAFQRRRADRIEARLDAIEARL